MDFEINSGSKLYTHIYTKSDSTSRRKRNTEVDVISDQTILERATEDCKILLGNDFEAEWVLIATWSTVKVKGSKGTATFQAVLITNYDKTCVKVFYIRGMMNIEETGNKKIGMGFRGDILSQKFSPSGTKRAFIVDTVEGNVKNPNKDMNYLGVFRYAISDIYNILPNPMRDCNTWYEKELPNKLDIYNQALQMPSCPGNYIYTWFDRRWSYLSSSRFYFCLYLRSSWWTWPATKSCCYSWWSWSIQTWEPVAGSYISHHPRWQADDYFENDATPYENCCILSSQCEKFYELRPIGSAYHIPPFFIAILFGDPHIGTLDGREYTFNGLGEYTMLTMEDTGDNPETFTLQARTAKALNAENQETKATIFSAFALTDSRGAKFQIELTPSRESLMIFANGYDLTDKFNAEEDYEYSDTLISVVRANKTITVVSETTSISANITVGIKMLTVSVSLTDDRKGKCKGLLGNFDDDKTNDFLLPNGTIMADDSTDRQIFNGFGEAWKVDKDTSIFTYTKGMSNADYNVAGFEPIFLDEIDQATKDGAKTICGDNIPCIFDYIQTKDENVAKDAKKVEEDTAAEKAALANEAPTINGSTKEIRVKVGEPIVFNYTISDTEDDIATIKLLSTPGDGFAVDEGTGVVTWTPSNASATTISLTAEDTHKATAIALEIKIIMCNDCDGHGVCDYNKPREASTEHPQFSLASCKCNIGYEGDDCEEDIDGCEDSPCSLDRTCSDVTAAEQTTETGSYTCGPCPDGYREDGQDCVDIDECSTANGGCTDTCSNTEGSFECSCPGGSRLQIGGKTCVDINECIEGTHDCKHTCVNTEPAYSCTCLTGFKLDTDGKSCVEDVPPNVCAGNECEGGRCTTGEDGSRLCFCLTGYELNSDGKTCNDTDECKANICIQDCANSDGSYTCSCNSGYQLNADKVSCDECDEDHWGINCGNECECIHGDCNPSRGCICTEGWTGTNCDDNVNECDDLTVCGTNEKCEDLAGSYICKCVTGFKKSADGESCLDIDECDNPILNTCPADSDCQNTVGSFSCSCNTGYKSAGTEEFSCIDVDECATASHGCEHICRNLNGSYNCECEFGYQLKFDRKTCEKVSDPCAPFNLTDCGYGCRQVDGSDPITVECFCGSGYYLGTNKKSCIDTDECADDDTNKCSNKDTCVNIGGGYTCSCPVGFRMENDKLTCTACDDQHYGENCNNTCDCFKEGSEGCDPVSGCQCKEGWVGDKCAGDRDECDTETCQDNAECINTPGSFKCVCNTGYALEGELCKDIDECATTGANICDQKCDNNVGSYACSCNSGFQWSAANSKCEDIDECTTNRDDCEHECFNTDGSYRCGCYAGHELNPVDRRSCTKTTNCTRTDCEEACKVDDSFGTCFCNKGRKLDTDGKSCIDIDMCTEGTPPCEDSCVNSPPGSYSCSCNNGSELNSDQVTCRDCPDWKWGDCQKDCDCVKANSESCNKVDGKCTCKPGWEGDTCNTDIDECTSETTYNCTSHSTCENRDSTYICKCDLGYVKSAGECTACDSKHFGENCASVCLCHSTQSESCRATDGHCTCKSGWTGDKCETDFKECEAATDPCADSAHSHCTELPGSYRCDCDSGYKKDANGTCLNVDECLEGKDNCVQVCTDNEGGFLCSCKEGFNGTGNDCTACSGWTYGLGCAESCTCVQNRTESCDTVNGSCTCKTGWEGDNCQTDIDECTTQNITCPDNAFCSNYGGGYLCECNEGLVKEYIGTTDNFECKTKFDNESQNVFKVKIKWDIKITTMWTVENDNDPVYKETKKNVQTALNDFYKNVARLRGFVEALIKSMKAGSLTVDHEVVMNKTGTADKDLSVAVGDALSGKKNLTYDGAMVPVLSVFSSDADGNAVELTSEDAKDKCKMYMAVNTCPVNEQCYLVKQEPTCRLIKDSDNIDMVIGLGVGIPLFLLICLIVTILVIYNKRMIFRGRRSKRSLHHTLDESYGGNAIFSNVMPTKFDSQRRQQPFYSPGGWETESESSRGSDETFRQERRRNRDGFSDLDQSRIAEPHYYDNGEVSNFSWDFMYKYFDPREKFEIKRPSTDFEVNERRNRDSAA